MDIYDAIKEMDFMDISDEFGVSDEIFKKIIDEIVECRRYDALVTLRQNTGMKASEATKKIVTLWQKICEKVMSNNKYLAQIAPEKCCLNCVGACGDKIRKIADGVWQASSETFVGSQCTFFIGKEEFAEFDKRIFVFTKDNNKRTYLMEKPIYELIIDRYGRNFRNNSPQRSKLHPKVKRRIIINESVFMQHCCRMMDRGWMLASKGLLDDTFVMFKQKPNEEETYAEYFHRAQADFRAKRLGIINEIERKSYEVLEEELREYFKENGTLTIIEETYNDSLEDFLRDFFPGKDIWEVSMKLNLEVI